MITDDGLPSSGQSQWLQERGNQHPRLVTTWLSRLARSSPELALQVLDKLWASRMEVNVFHLNAVCAGGARSWHWPTVLFAKMADMAVEADTVSFNSAIVAFKRCTLWLQALSWFGSVRAVGAWPDETSYSAAITACETNLMWRLSVALLSELSQSLAPNAICWSAEISLAATCAKWVLATSCLRRMGDSFVRPDKFSLSASIAACGKCFLWQFGIINFAAISAASESPDVVACNSAIKACGEAGGWPMAIAFTGLIRRSRTSLDQIGVTSMLDSLKSSDDRHLWEQALCLQMTVTRTRLRTDQVSCSALMQQCSKCAAWQQSTYLFCDMQRSKISVDETCYGTFVTIAAKGKEWRMCLSAVNQHDPTMPSLNACHATALSCSKAGSWWAGLHVLNSVGPCGLRLDCMSRSGAVVCMERGSKWDLGLSLTREKGGWDGGLVAAAAVASASVSRWGTAFAILESNHHLAAKIDIMALNTVLKTCAAKLGKWPAAVACVQSFHTKRCSPHVSSIAACEAQLWAAALSDCFGQRLAGRAEVAAEKVAKTLAETSQWSISIQIFKGLNSRAERSPSFACLVYSIAGRWQKAISAARMLSISNETEASARVSCNTCMSACGKAEEWLQAVAALQALLSGRMEMDIVSVNAGINACRIGGCWQGSIFFLAALSHSGLVADTFTPTATIGSVAAVGKWEQGLVSMERMKQVWQSATALGATISGCASAVQWAKALNLCRWQEGNLASYSAAMSACEKNGLWQKSLSLLQRISDVALCADLIAFDAAVAVFAKAEQSFSLH
ncbi:unnamed protein product [Effrenium voratum]|nr:unnamed protein product [Effrenium voratum]